MKGFVLTRSFTFFIFTGNIFTMNFKVSDKNFNLDNDILVMAIVNVTDDSFSDGGLYNNLDKAKAHALSLIRDGAHIIDIGGESTRPGAKEVSIDEECSRVVPLIESLKDEDIIMSVDTMKPQVAAAALKAGASIVNDVTALSYGMGEDGDVTMAEVIKEHNASVVLMHMRGTPRTMQVDTHYGDIVDDIKDYLKERVEFAESCGIERDKICIDPGIGFGKSLEGNFEIIRRLDEFKELNLPVLIGLSRKSFIGKSFNIDDPLDRGEATEICHGFALNGGAQILRTHDVKKTRKTIENYLKYRGNS